MSQKTHIMHGRDHLPWGADPIPGLPFPVGDDVADIILGLPGLSAFWKLNETTGVVAYDSGPNGHHLQPQAGKIPPVWGQPAGPPGDTTAKWETDNNRLGRNAGVAMTGFVDNFSAGVFVKIETLGGFRELIGQGTAGYHVTGGGGWALLMAGTKAGVGVHGTISYGNNDLADNSWYFLAVVRDAGTWKLYVNGLLQAGTQTTTPTANVNSWLGNDGLASHGSYLIGQLSYGFMVDGVLSSTELLQIWEAALLGGALDAGLVLTSDGEGGTVWAPPTITVTGGGGPPDDTPVTAADGGGSGATSPDGWHLNAHEEIAVLYDSTPGRFDVPSRRWTRVPFDTVRLWRQWETTVGSTAVKQAWLPDDRGLTGAQNGVLHVTAEMVWSAANKYLGGYFSIEYPVLDWQGLPDDDPALAGSGPRPAVDPDPGGPIAYDDYLRAARMVNASDGTVVRLAPGFPTWRRFFEWVFHDNADGIPVAVNYNGVDQPYPIYPATWPARPLSMALPYPKLSPTDSLDYYTNSLGQLGFDEQNLQVEIDPDAGDNFCLQAWQDSPWPLRFSTDRFPNYTRDVLPAFLARPHLSLSYRYDPDTVDHTTGKLLL